MMMQMILTPGYFDRCSDRYGTCLIHKHCAALQGEPFIVEECDEIDLTVYGVTATTETGERYFVRFELYGRDSCMDFDHPSFVERIPWKYNRSFTEKKLYKSQHL